MVKYVGLMVCAVCLLNPFSGCARHQSHPSITAVGLSPANRCDPPGIPYYLPKPLLVVAKNVRHIDESKVGLTGPAPIPGGFDNQAAYGDIKANVTVPSSPGGSGTAAAGLQAANVPNEALSTATLGGDLAKSTVDEKMTPAASDRFNGGVELDSFFTYQVIFIPDLSQKYGLQITGGAGEFRAAMNLVNGWMYTGMGPFYFKDSSSAQNAMATGVGAMYAGRGVADVVSSVGDLASSLTGSSQESTLSDADVMQLNNQLQALQALAQSTPKVPKEMLNYAEIYIYEPILLPDQSTDWRLVAEHHFDRHYFDDASDAASIKAKHEILQSLLSGISTGKVPAQPGTKLSPGTQQESSTTDTSEDAAALLLQNGGSGTSSESSQPRSLQLNPPPQVPAPMGNLPAPAVEINVLPNSGIPPQSLNAPPAETRHSLFRRETAKIEQRTGNRQIEIK